MSDLHKKIPWSETLDAVLDACDGACGVLDDGKGPRCLWVAHPPRYFAALAQATRTPPRKRTPPPREKAACRDCKRSFKRIVGSKATLCKKCLHENARARRWRRAERPWMP